VCVEQQHSILYSIQSLGLGAGGSHQQIPAAHTHAAANHLHAATAID